MRLGVCALTLVRICHPAVYQIVPDRRGRRSRRSRRVRRQIRRSPGTPGPPPPAAGNAPLSPPQAVVLGLLMPSIMRLTGSRAGRIGPAGLHCRVENLWRLLGHSACSSGASRSGARTCRAAPPESITPRRQPCAPVLRAIFLSAGTARVARPIQPSSVSAVGICKEGEVEQRVTCPSIAGRLGHQLAWRARRACGDAWQGPKPCAQQPSACLGEDERDAGQHHQVLRPEGQCRHGAPQQLVAGLQGGGERGRRLEGAAGAWIRTTGVTPAAGRAPQTPARCPKAPPNRACRPGSGSCTGLRHDALLAALAAHVHPQQRHLGGDGGGPHASAGRRSLDHATLTPSVTSAAEGRELQGGVGRPWSMR